MMLKEGGSKLATEYEFDVGYLADEEDLEPVEGVECMAELLRQGADESRTPKASVRSSSHAFW